MKYLKWWDVYVLLFILSIKKIAHIKNIPYLLYKASDKYKKNSVQSNRLVKSIVHSNCLEKSIMRSNYLEKSIVQKVRLKKCNA